MFSILNYHHIIRQKKLLFLILTVILDSENSHFIAFNEGLKILTLIFRRMNTIQYILDDRGVITNVVNDKNISVTNEEIDRL